MSLLLRAAAWWTPPFILSRELQRVAGQTTAALDALLEEHAPRLLAQVRRQDAAWKGRLAQRRAAMSAAHNARVAALVEALGRDEAVRLGRETLFPVGVRLGQEVRRRLGVGDDVADLLRAARVLYRVLGIHFEFQWQAGGRAVLHVYRCALAAHYAEVTCVVLSATDEGVVRGLNPGLDMAFSERITAGLPRCVAHLHRKTPEV